MKYANCTTCNKQIYIGAKIFIQKVCGYGDLIYCTFDCLHDKDDYFKRLPLTEENCIGDDEK